MLITCLLYVVKDEKLHSLRQNKISVLFHIEALKSGVDYSKCSIILNTKVTDKIANSTDSNQIAPEGVI